MKLNPKATATIIIGGLALCHRNRKNDTWEALFIRDKENFHNLKIKVGYGTTQDFEINIDQGMEVSIKVTFPKSKTDSYQPTEKFNRSYALDAINDLRWVLDFSSSELHNRRLKIEKRERDNFFFTPNALFYTLSLSNKHYLLQKNNNNIPVGVPVSLQDIGEFIGADIECEDKGNVTIETKNIGGAIKSYPLKKGAEVFFDNRCFTNSPVCSNDFIRYYDVIKPGSEKFELQYSPTLIEDWIKNPSLLEGPIYICESAMIDLVDNPNDTLNNY